MPVCSAKDHTRSSLLRVFTDMCSCVSIVTEVLHPLRTPRGFISLMEESTPKTPRNHWPFLFLLSFRLCRMPANQKRPSIVRRFTVASLPQQYAFRILPRLWGRHNSSLLQLRTLPSWKHQGVPSHTPAEGPMSWCLSQLCSCD